MVAAVDKKISLSYVLTTRNKLVSLKIVLAALIASLEEDEEIIVMDGASSDGTPEYLQQLYLEGKLSLFKSEPDCGESHGFNRAILSARGTLIKIMTDDDSFYLPAIKDCKEFMLSNPKVDLLCSDGGNLNLGEEAPIQPMIYQAEMGTWLKNRRPFAFCGLGLLLRRSSLSLTGLFHTGIMRIDAEFGLKVTSIKKLNLAWYSSPMYVRILNEGSNSVRFTERLTTELINLENFYLPFSLGLKILHFRQRALMALRKSFLRDLWLLLKSKKMASKIAISNDQIFAEAFRASEEWLALAYSSKAVKFVGI